MQAKQKLTRLQRHTAYIIMLAGLDFNEDEMKNPCPFICNIFRSLFGYEFDNCHIEKMLPEFRKYKPRKMTEDGGWFKTGSYEIRRNILKQCIEETY